MQAHHEEYPYETLESIIVQVADAVSAGRPGARRELAELEAELAILKAAADLVAAGAPHKTRLWAMIETPRAVFDIEKIASAADDHAVVRYQHYALDSHDVIGHLHSGKVPTKLAMTYNARVSFILVDDLRIQKIEINTHKISPSELSW